MSLLELEDVNGYYGKSQVLFDLNLTVDTNEVVALLGRNGAGKTSTLRTITGMIPGRNGRIRFSGKELSTLSIDKISNRGLKLVPEERRIFPTLTVEENLLVAHDTCKGTKPRPIEDMYEIFPILQDVNQNLGRNLSGGERQMLSVARALIQNPKLLLLDEPTEGLAPVIVDDLTDILEEIVSQDVTVLLTEQNVDFALNLSERAYIIEKGTNAWEGSVEELEERDDLLDQYLSVGGE